MDNLDQVHCHAWIHCLISTKDETPSIQLHFKEELHELIQATFSSMGSTVRIINSSPTHLNCLFNLNPSKSVQEIIDKVRDVSSQFINSKTGVDKQSIWEEDFSCISVDATNIEEVYSFIRDQEIRNLQNNNISEFSQFLEVHGVDLEAAE
ncbi:transposase [Brumimicrobium oceani]|uniref:Transposase IS200-like domain-containing protein n=1 Tax=Brumimicrobium oceani TaxID=2100725 RepID=A0A2U2XDG6_9FLAO|nr:transposase [Brumimicrobium oceani]PWH85849.1 hypothetical protein DIT68_07070 [Brumimicrobium oceani]